MIAYAITELHYPLSEILKLNDRERAFLYAAINLKNEAGRKAQKEIESMKRKR